ncbi:hypothetical protein ACNKHL_09945 [Shigella flexneri]
MLADGAFFRDYCPWLAEENTNANIQGLNCPATRRDGHRSGESPSGPGRCRDEIALAYFALSLWKRVHEPWALAIYRRCIPYGALTRLWSPVMTALLRAS